MEFLLSDCSEFQREDQFNAIIKQTNPPYPPPGRFRGGGILSLNILSLTLTLGCKNKKRPSGPVKLDLEAGNLVLSNDYYKMFEE